MKKIGFSALVISTLLAGTAYAADVNSPLAASAVKFTFNNGSLLIDEDKNAFAEYGRWELGYGKVEYHGNRVQTGPLEVGYDPRAWFDKSLSLGTKGVRSFHAGVAAGVEEDGAAAWLGRGFSFGRWNMAGTVGAIQLKDSFLGYDMDGDTKALYATAGLWTNLSPRATAGVDGTLARARYSGSADLDKGSLTMGSARVNLGVALTDRSKTTFSIGTPLGAIDGARHLELRQRSYLRDAVDIGAAHTFELGRRSLVTLAVGARATGSQQKSWAEAGYSFRF